MGSFDKHGKEVKVLIALDEANDRIRSYYQCDYRRRYKGKYLNVNGIRAAARGGFMNGWRKKMLM